MRKVQSSEDGLLMEANEVMDFIIDDIKVHAHGLTQYDPNCRRRAMMTESRRANLSASPEEVV